jgi:hypothetical protein
MNPHSNLRAWAVTILLTGVIGIGRADELATNATAGPGVLLWDKGSVSFGGYLAAFDSNLSFGTPGAAVTLNAEQLLGLQTRLSVYRANAMYRPGESRRNQIDFTYAAYNRSGSGTLAQDVVINGITYPVGAQLDTTFDFDIIRCTYSYAVLQDDRMRIALGAGLYVVPLHYSFNGQTTGGGTAVEGDYLTIPLPAFSYRGDFALNPKLFLTTSIDGMYLKISNFAGSILDVSTGLEYRPWRHFGLGLQYASTSIFAEGQADSSSYPGGAFVGTISVRFTGLMLYGKYAF